MTMNEQEEQGSLGKRVVRNILSWVYALLKIVVVIFILAVAKVLLRTNTELAVAILGGTAALFLVWYFFADIKRLMNNDS